MKTKDRTGNSPGGREKRVLYLDMGCDWGELEGVRKRLWLEGLFLGLVSSL